MENKEDLQFKRAESYTSTRKTAGASQRGLTSGREDGRRRGLRERERHVQRRRPDLGASPATAAAACKHEATCKSATSRNSKPTGRRPGDASAIHLPSCPSPPRAALEIPWPWTRRAPDQRSTRRGWENGRSRGGRRASYEERHEHERKRNASGFNWKPSLVRACGN